MIWYFISCTLFDCHKSEAHTIKISTSSGDINVALKIIGFVDDMTCTRVAERKNTVKYLLSKMQDDAQLWKDVIWCSVSNLQVLR